METTRIITITTISALIFSFVLFFIGMDFLQDSENFLQESFFSSIVNSSTNKIFLLGSSQISALNTTTIENILTEHGDTVQVYNLGKFSDTPSQRLHTIDYIIASHPKLVVYGIGYRDFITPYPKESFSIVKETPLFDVSTFFKNLYSQIIPDLENFFPSNPQLVTFNSMKNILRKFQTEGITEVGYTPYPHTPFIKITPDHTVIKNTTQLEQAALSDEMFSGNINKHHENFDALKKIIIKLQENNIPIILFTTPYSPLYLNSIPQYDQEQFHLILNDLSKHYDVKLYFLDNTFDELNIWNDNAHIAINNNSTIYPTLIAQFIESDP